MKSKDHDALGLSWANIRDHTTLGLFFLLVVEFPKAFGALRYLGQTDRQTDRQLLLCSDGDGGGDGGGGSGGEESR
jgi:hypothetical protein